MSADQITGRVRAALRQMPENRPPSHTDLMVSPEEIDAFLAENPPHWVCDTCTDLGWIDERVGGSPTSGWVTCPDCSNSHGKTRP